MQLPNDKNVTASVSFADADGNPAKVDGAPVWASDNEAVATVAASSDGMSAVVTSVGLGTAQISVVADADLGSGVVELKGLGSIEVISGTAVTATINFGEPA